MSASWLYLKLSIRSFEHRGFAGAQPHQALIRVMQSRERRHPEREVKQAIPVMRPFQARAGERADDAEKLKEGAGFAEVRRPHRGALAGEEREHEVAGDDHDIAD